jgi:DNA polymerase II large subunit
MFKMPPFSDKIKKYMDEIHNKVIEAEKIGKEARIKGFDPEETTEMPIVENMAERVEGLISVVSPQIANSGVSERIKELEKKYGSLDWRVALTISLEITQEKYCKFKDKKEAMEIGIRTGFAYLTMGIVASPLEGFVELKFRRRKDNSKEYFAVSYAGPVRSAGGTGASVSLLLVDYIRKNMGYETYDPSEEEIKRYVTELYDYHDRITNLQYLPSEEEIDFLARHLPIQLDGDASEQIEVSNYKDLDRVETNRIRNGVCLVMGEGIAQKAEKVWKQLSKWGKDFGLEHWNFMGDFVKLKKEIHAKGAKTKSDDSNAPKILPDYTFIKDLVGGRPIFTHPLREGGFRLRYGRSRTSGYSSYSVNPCTMFILNDYLAIGTQMRNERPGKGCTVTPCDTIEGPIVLLEDNSLVYLDNVNEAKRISSKIKKIIYLGDILINYGDFFNRAHKLVPPGYCEEWWALEFEKALVDKTTTISIEKLNELKNNYLRKFPSATDAITLSEELSIPLHPKYTYHYKSIDINKIKDIRKIIKSSQIKLNEEGCVKKIIICYNKELKNNFELLGVPHILVNNEFIVIEGNHATILNRIFVNEKESNSENVFDYLYEISNIKIRDKSGIFIGARMGRPEKGKMRKLNGSPHVLFPVGEEGGRLKSFQSAFDAKKITSDFSIMYCPICNIETIFKNCEECNSKTIQTYSCGMCKSYRDRDQRKACEEKNKFKETCNNGNKRNYTFKDIDIKYYFEKALKACNMDKNVFPDLIKGLKETSNKTHIVEHLSKGILRAKHDVFVNKDGTVRYDMTQTPITHFKPIEIGTSIDRLKILGYEKDIHGNDLVDKNQILEIFPQDIILPRCKDCPEQGSHEVLKRVCNFIDDLLVNFYNLKPYYNVEKEEDLTGHIVLCLAPHTSAGISARIIGFSDTQCFFAHPLIHAATRRDCDGDEACVVMLLDAFLNFSKHYLPAHRGSKQDAPLVITWLLTPAEVDDMVFDVDVVSRYPLEFYEACLEYKNPWDVKIETIKKRLGTEKQYEDMGFTHDTTNFNTGVLCSAYKTLPSMEDKLKGQMEIAVKIRAVDASDVACLTIEKHFIKDTKGNLRKFSMQQFRCVGCNEKYRRPPLSGKCIKCGGKIIFTISEGSIIKYLQPSLDLAEKYDVSPYLKQTLEILRRRVESVFGKEKDKQEGLNKWF